MTPEISHVHPSSRLSLRPRYLILLISLCAADKEDLKTQLAKDLCAVREKEMAFYARNLSMVGTHAALLAGFAFTILSQYKFKEPMEGYLDYETEEALGMWKNNRAQFMFPQHSESQVRSFKKGFSAWTWNTWFQQIFQILHLLFTSLGMTLTLWTLYTSVITNILGVHLALRGPEGSIDKAVRHGCDCH